MKQAANPLRGLHRNGTSLHEAINLAFPAHLVTPRLTDAEQLAWLEARRTGAKPVPAATTLRFDANISQHFARS